MDKVCRYLKQRKRWSFIQKYLCFSVAAFLIWSALFYEHINSAYSKGSSKIRYKMEKSKNLPPRHKSCNVCSNVLIVGYFRGGSTMTLDVLSESDNNFYVFEPINFLSFDTYENTPITFLNGTSRLLNKDTELPGIQAEMLMNWFNCKLKEINLSDLRSSNLLYHSHMTHIYYNCQKKLNISSCLKLLEQKCTSNANKIFKVVRLRINTTEKLLKNMDDLKIIHLVRDPRGMLTSLLRSKLIAKNELKARAFELCNHMSMDINSTSKLKQNYLQNIFMLKYEALVQNPIEIFKQMFNFANLKFSQKVESYVRNHLLGSSVGGQNAFITKSGNASKIANNWRDSITIDELNIIDTNCRSVYKALGYTQADQQILRDRTVSLQSKPSLKHLMDFY